MIEACNRDKDEYDYYITFEELRTLVKCLNIPKVKDYYKLITWFLILTGRRTGEILAIQLQDFSGFASFDFSKLSIRLEKSGKVVTVYLTEPLQALVRTYIVKHHSKLRNGYLFPKTSFNGLDRPYMRTEDYSSFFSKLRKRCAEYMPSFNERYPSSIYRIHPHTLRHFFEDYGLQTTNSLLFVKELMGYQDLGTVIVYANRKRIREQIPKFYNKEISELGSKLDGLVEGQKNMDSYL